MPFINVVIANEEDCDLCLGIQAGETDVEAGHLNVAAYESVARQIVSDFPNVDTVAITLRESLSLPSASFKRTSKTRAPSTKRSTESMSSLTSRRFHRSRALPSCRTAA